MKRFYIIGFLTLMAFDTLAQISFKYTAMDAEPLTFDAAWFLRILGNPWVYGALCGYLGAFVIWMSLLRHAPVGPSFAASHLELVSVAFFSVWLFNEPLTVPKIAGGLLILLGVLCLAKGEEKEKVADASVPSCSGASPQPPL
ncbi:MAG: EamA family transporter [Desulfovibrio sp.]|jgi:drug/metabolite transporter (DMT)-like permease|nr:EamA family transporter [Desulfovibrio sp.]